MSLTGKPFPCTLTALSVAALVHTRLSVDVPKTVTDNFRARSAPRGWAVAGYSAGAHCAARLAVAHPDHCRAAVSLSGYNDPIGSTTRYEDAMALEQAAEAPTTVHVVHIPKSAGGHNMALWRPQVVPVFRC
ncbi:alpha/beta hydrolase-fold protein [Streptomyces sp. NPDC101116]|uniref:alpha/beta hydrolase-fold protein n=1 Tax=Streptomyces sp. NPDC101116 TaxID=3366107 RepID=UPI00380F07AB